MRFVAIFLILLNLSSATQARCYGRDLLRSASPAFLAELEQATARHPFAKGRYWEVSKNGKSSWIIGTIHLDDRRLRTVPKFFARKIGQAQAVMVELTPEMAGKLQQYQDQQTDRFIRKNGKPVRQSFTAEQWAKIVTIAKSKGIAPALLQRANPMAIAAMLSKPLCASNVKRFLDLNIMHSAMKSHVPLIALDDLSDLEHRISTAAGNDRHFLKISKMQLAHWDSFPDRIETIVQLYRQGETAKVREYEFLLLKSYTTDPALIRANRNDYAGLIAKRNNIWMNKLRPRLTQGNAVIAVGAMHLSGKRGLLYRLQQQGFQIKRLLL